MINVTGKIKDCCNEIPRNVGYLWCYLIPTIILAIINERMYLAITEQI